MVFSTNDSAILDIRVRKKKKKNPRHTDTYLHLSKNKVKMDPRPTCKMQNYKTFRREVKSMIQERKKMLGLTLLKLKIYLPKMLLVE